MAGQAKIVGIPAIPSITEINVRSGPHTSHDLIFKIPVGMSGLDVLEVRQDEQNTQHEGKTYQWFKLQFHGGAVGWVRDDLIEVKGDLTTFGYPQIADYILAFDLLQQPEGAPAAGASSTAVVDTDAAAGMQQEQSVGVRGSAQVATEPVSNERAVAQPAVLPPHASGDHTPAPQDVERVRRLAFLITGAFEGGAYDAYNNYDAGIVSYGIMQFTLAASSLGTVVQRYINQSNSDHAQTLQKYWDRIQAKDPQLRNDQGFKQALMNAAQDEVMRGVQDQVAAEGYWQKVVDGYITHRGLKLPLTWALLFDMGVNFGVNHGFVRLAEKQLGVPPRSKPGENGVTEEQLTGLVVALRKESHYKQAEKDNLPGLKRRADFWTNLVNTGDWYLQGDFNGKINVLGRIIDAHNP